MRLVLQWPQPQRPPRLSHHDKATQDADMPVQNLDPTLWLVCRPLEHRARLRPPSPPHPGHTPAERLSSLTPPDSAEHFSEGLLCYPHLPRRGLPLPTCRSQPESLPCWPRSLPGSPLDRSSRPPTLRH